MPEQMFFRDGRWVPRSQLLKTVKVKEVETVEEVKVDEVVITPEEDKKLLELLDLKKHLESLTHTQIKTMAKELGMKTAFRTNEEMINYILNNKK